MQANGAGPQKVEMVKAAQVGAGAGAAVGSESRTEAPGGNGGRDSRRDHGPSSPWGHVGPWAA